MCDSLQREILIPGLSLARADVRTRGLCVALLIFRVRSGNGPMRERGGRGDGAGVGRRTNKFPSRESVMEETAGARVVGLTTRTRVDC